MKSDVLQLVTCVCELKLLNRTPCDAPVIRKLEFDWLGINVRWLLSTTSSDVELNHADKAKDL